MGKTRESALLAECAGLAAAIDSPAGRELEQSLARDLETVRRAVRERLGSRVHATVLGGSYARGEGCPWERHGELVPGPNLNIFIITGAPVSDRELEETTREILGGTLVESVVLTALERGRFDGLLPSLDLADLRDGHRVVDGDPDALARLLARAPRQFGARDAEERLRSRLATLLEGHPGGRESLRSYYHAAKAIFAGVDAFLIRNGCYASSYRDKVLRFRGLAADRHLADLAGHALDVKLHGARPHDRDAAGFWQAAARFHLDSLIGLLHPRGTHRRDRLGALLATFHFRTASAAGSLAGLARTVLGRNRRGTLERLLLALAIDRDPGGPVVDVLLEARRAAAAGETWEEIRDDAVARWRRARRPPW